MYRSRARTREHLQVHSLPYRTLEFRLGQGARSRDLTRKCQKVSESDVIPGCVIPAKVTKVRKVTKVAILRPLRPSETWDA